MAPEFDHVKLKALLRTGGGIAVLGGSLLGVPPIGYEDVGESQRQEDRRGTLAVESGPPMRGSI
jgi:hypothetical protein